MQRKKERHRHMRQKERDLEREGGRKLTQALLRV